MKEFMNKKGVYPSLNVYFIDALSAMALGLFASLLIGTIIKTLGDQFHIAMFSEQIWPITQQATGAAIGVAIAHRLNAPYLVLYTAVAVGLAGYEQGGPVGTFIATILAVEVGKLISKETKIDIIVTPFVTLMVGFLVASLFGPVLNKMMIYLGEVIILATHQHPFIMGILVSVIVGMVLTLPISSAALCIMLNLSGIAAGAATIGCTAQMIGFAVISYKDNGLNESLAQGLGTSMLQVPNIIRNWKIWIPPTLTAGILGPIATVWMPVENTPLGAGMGSSGLVGQISTFQAMKDTYSPMVIFLYLLVVHFILPAVLSYVFYRILLKQGAIKAGDMTIIE